MKKDVGIVLLSGKIHIVDSYFLLLIFSLLLAVSFLSAQVGWSPDVRLTYMQGGGRYPRAACCGDTIHLVWWQHYGVSGQARDEIYYLRSTDAGESWSEPVRLSVEDDKKGVLPWVAVSNNSVHVVWQQQDVGICYRKSTDGANSWLLVDTIPNGGSGNPSVSVSGSNIYVVAYRTDGKIIFSRSTDNGNTWLPSQEIGFNLANKPRIKSISSGEDLIFLVCEDKPYTVEIYFVRSTDGGSTWIDSQFISGNDSIGSQHPSLDVDDGTEIHITWYDYKYSPYPWTGDIFYRASRDSGNTWEPIDSLTVQHRAVASDILAEGSNLHLVWDDERNGNFEIYYRMSSDLGQSWGPEIRLTDAINSSSRPSLACGGGYLHLFWQDARDDSIGARNAIYYKRKDLSGGVSELEGNLSSGIDFGVFPNPFSKKIAIRCLMFDTGGSIKIKFFDVLGKEVLAYETEGRRVEISTRSLSCGVYFVEVWAGGNRSIRKVVKIE